LCLQRLVCIVPCKLQADFNKPQVINKQNLDRQGCSGTTKTSVSYVIVCLITTHFLKTRYSEVKHQGL
jgi:hypothetical protein